VHNFCRGKWERYNSSPDAVAWYCSFHHSTYKYKNALDKSNSPSCTSYPPNEVFHAASPVDSSITGAGAILARPVNNSRKKRMLLKAAGDASGKRNGIANGTGKQK
jgi:hypothetical protein